MAGKKIFRLTTNRVGELILKYP